MNRSIALPVLLTVFLTQPGLAQNQTSMFPPGTEPALDAPINWGGTIAQDVLWNNGWRDFRNGLSNAIERVFGAQRTLLFDFAVPSGEVWEITGLEWFAVWNDLPPGSGTGAAMRIREDVGDMPGAPITSTRITTSYQEIPNFIPPGYLATAGFDPATLRAGRYWLEATVIGPENNFWETAVVIDNQVWVDYADFGGLQPGIDVFGVEYDINGRITGQRLAGFTLTVTGPCPEMVTIEWSGATPDALQFLVVGDRLGRTRMGGDPCRGVIFGIQGHVRGVDPPGFFRTGEFGSGTYSRKAHPAACGRYLQLTDGRICETSNVAQIPPN